MKAILIFLLAITSSCSSKQEADSVSMPNNIPKDAFFVKGKTGGYWCQVDVHSHKNNAFITMYDGISGKLIKSKQFFVICIVQGNPLSLEDPKHQIDYFDGEKFHLKRLASQDSCWLQ